MNDYCANLVPYEWELKPLGEIAVIKTGGPAPQVKAHFENGNQPFVRVQHFDGSRKYVNRWDLITDAAVRAKHLQRFPKDTILFPKSGASIRLEKRAKLPCEAYVVSHLCCVSPTKVDNDFLYYWLKGERFAQTSGGSTLPYLNMSHIAERKVPLPPLPEQKKIAHVLSTVQRAIEAQERIIQTTTELKKTLMHKLFTEGLRNEPQKQTEIGLIPESWETPTVEAVCTIKASAMSYKQLEDAPNVPNGIRVVGIKVSDMNLPDNEIEFRSANLERFLSKKEALKRTVPDNSIVFPKRGAAIATNKKRLTTSRTVLDPNLIAVIPSEAVNHRYLFHWFNTFDLKKITDPGPTPQLNKKDIAPLKFPMPPFAEQEAIAVAIDAAEEKTTLNGRKRDQLKDLFRTLLHELMTAKIRVDEFDINVSI